MATSKEDHPFHVYQGVSERRSESEGPSLEEALDSAWEDAVSAGFEPSEGRLRVVEIQVEGSNPIDMFRILVTDA